MRIWDLAFSSSAVAYLVLAIVLNIPFLLCHPDWTIVEMPVPRSLCINLVLFLVPGLPFVGVMVRKGWLQRFELLGAIGFSFVIFLAVLGIEHIVGLPAKAGLMWNGTWAVTNLGLLLYVLGGGPSLWRIRVNLRRACSFILLFIAAYLAFFYGATRIVPVLGDQDGEVQGTAYALMTRMEPSLDTSRNTEYLFAHPPLLNFYVAGSLMYFNLLSEMALYDPQSPDHLSLRESYKRYMQHPYLQETRTPNIFLSALTVALLGFWVGRVTGRQWLGLLVAFAYGSTAEVFVRSVYGGYFAIGNFALLQILLAVEVWMTNRGRSAWLICFLSGVFAALADHKMMFLPMAVVIWEALGSWREIRFIASVKALLNPVAVGFVAGSALFWSYGLAISRNDFWMDHVRHHFVDRVLNYNARGLDMSRYPSLGGLWLEFWQHTGYLLLPLGAIALWLLCFRNASTIKGENPQSVSGWRGMPGLWAIWALLAAIAFSIVDWRQTKHLAPLTLPLFLAISQIGIKRIQCVIVDALLIALAIWNVGILYIVAGNFEFLEKMPEW